jgi:hypothetical protein
MSRAERSSLPLVGDDGRLTQAGRHLGGPPERLRKYLDERRRAGTWEAPYLRPRQDGSPFPPPEGGRLRDRSP